MNLHHHAQLVENFLSRPRFSGWVSSVYESELLGTAGTLEANRAFFQEHTTLLVHADNWCQCDFTRFLNFHRNHRPENCPITMMTFKTPTPRSCGIVDCFASRGCFAPPLPVGRGGRVRELSLEKRQRPNALLYQFGPSRASRHGFSWTTLRVRTRHQPINRAVGARQAPTACRLKHRHRVYWGSCHVVQP
mgnify:CR=1 FL=1